MYGELATALIVGGLCVFFYLRADRVRHDAIELAYDMLSEGDAHRQALVQQVLDQMDRMYGVYCRVALKTCVIARSTSGQEASIAAGNMTQVDVLADTELKAKMDEIARAAAGHQPFPGFGPLPGQTSSRPLTDLPRTIDTPDGDVLHKM